MILAWDLSRGCSHDVSQSGRALRVGLEDLLPRRSWTGRSSPKKAFQRGYQVVVRELLDIGKRSLFPTTWASPTTSQVSSWCGSSFLQREWWSRRDQSRATVFFMSLGSPTQSSPWRSLGHSSQLYSVGMPAQRQTYRVSENLWEPSWMMIITNTIYYNSKNRAFKRRNKHKVFERFCAENCKALPREIEEFLNKWKNMLC